MKTRLLTWLLCAFVAALIPAAAPSTGALNTMTITGFCPDGTNWDEVLQRCV